MNYKYQFIDETDKQNIINVNQNKTLIEEQHITEGNFLIFSDIKPIENQLLDLNDNTITLMDVLATIYEGMLEKGTV